MDAQGGVVAMIDQPDIRMRHYSAKDWQMVSPYNWRGVSIPILCRESRDGVTKYLGFLHDAGSIPAWLPRGLVDSEGRGLAAFINHDYRYSYPRRTKCDRKVADTLLRNDLLRLGFESWRANAVYYSVRAFGWIPYLRGRRHQDDDAYHYAPIPPIKPGEFVSQLR